MYINTVCYCIPIDSIINAIILKSGDPAKGVFKMTNTEMIKKFELKVITQNEKEGLKVGFGKPTTSEIEFIKANKTEIIFEIKLQNEKELLEKLNKDIPYTLNDSTSYGIYNGISEFEIGEIITDIKSKLGFKKYLEHSKIAKTLTKDPEIEQIAINNYQPDSESKNWNDEYRTWFRSAVEKKTAPGKGFISNQIIREKITNIVLGIMDKEQGKENAELQIFAKAKQTGVKQVLKSYMTECNDPNEECSQDHVVIYAMPNGTKKTERMHTW